MAFSSVQSAAIRRATRQILETMWMLSIRCPRDTSVPSVPSFVNQRMPSAFTSLDINIIDGNFYKPLCADL